jgi:hypothetical protein
MSPRSRAEWQIALWCIFLIAFVAAGSLPLGSFANQRPVRNQSPLNSVDAVLYREFGLEDGASVIAKSLDQIPATTPITIVYPSQDSRTLAGIVTTQLVWPHPAKEIRYRAAFGTDVDLEQVRARGGAAIFLGTDAPSKLGKVKSLRPRVHIVYLSTAS